MGLEWTAKDEEEYLNESWVPCPDCSLKDPYHSNCAVHCPKDRWTPVTKKKNTEITDKIIELLVLCNIEPSEKNIKGVEAYLKLLRATDAMKHFGEFWCNTPIILFM